jgi:hypothetical protein
MEGDERVRFCALCSKNVYNLSAMSRSEAEALVREQEGRLCVRFYRRRDGTLLTDNCPVGFRRMRRSLLAQMSAVSGMFLMVPGLGVLLAWDEWRRWGLWQFEPFRSIGEQLGFLPSPCIMGRIAAPPAIPGPAKPNP